MFRPRKISKASILTVLMLAYVASSQAATIIAASLLPVSEYTRITIESDVALTYSTLTLKNPNRIVLDLKNTPDTSKMKALSAKLLPNDATIKQIRVGKFQQNTTRVVIDLRANATPKITLYSPASGYQYRLALDVAPAQSAPAGDDNVQENVSESNTPSNTQLTKDDDNGAKIILNREPVFEPDLEADLEMMPNQ